MYEFKRIQEFAWAVGVAAIPVVYKAIEETSLADALADPKVWGLALAVGIARAVVGAALAFRSRSQQP